MTDSCTYYAVEEKLKQRELVHNAELEAAAAARDLTVFFNADVSDSLPWKFTPTQRSVNIKPGESTLAFYTAQNNSDKSITGVSTYNVTPQQAGVYFNKIQCFCFEEQKLRPGEKIDMPVFFYVDPEFATDPKLRSFNPARKVNGFRFSVSPCMCILHLLCICTFMQGEGRCLGIMSDEKALIPSTCNLQPWPLSLSFLVQCSSTCLQFADRLPHVQEGPNEAKHKACISKWFDDVVCKAVQLYTMQHHRHCNEVHHDELLRNAATMCNKHLTVYINGSEELNMNSC